MHRINPFISLRTPIFSFIVTSKVALSRINGVLNELSLLVMLATLGYYVFLYKTSNFCLKLGFLLTFSGYLRFFIAIK